jgi:hypothetical protein
MVTGERRAGGGSVRVQREDEERMRKTLSTAELLIGGGAALILLVADFLLGALLGGNAAGVAGVPIWIELPAAELLLMLVVRGARPGLAWPISYGLILSALVVAGVVPIVSDFLRIFRSLGAFLDAPILTLLIELCLWVASGLMVAGVILYWRRGGD